MALVVENGFGLSNANSYVGVSDADAYHALRGCIPWTTLTTTQKEEAIIRSTDYIEQVYGLSFQGYRLNSTQALSFPRIDVLLNGYYVASDTIPTILVNACCELAYKAAQGNLSPDITQAVKREKVDVLEVEYMDNSSPITRIRAIDNLLAPLLKNLPSGSMRMVTRV